MILPQAVRRLAASPGFTALSVLTLAVGIAAATAIFSVVDAVAIRPLPYPDSDRLVVPMHDAPGRDIFGFGQAHGTYRLYRRDSRVFDDMAIYSELPATLIGMGDPVRLEGLFVTPSIFPVLGLRPTAGRGFQEADGLPQAAPVVMLSDELWRSRFGADRGLIGRSVHLNGKPREVVGILPPGLSFPRRGIDVWMAKDVDMEGTDLGVFGDQGVARLAPGVTVEAAQAELNRLVADIEARFPGERAAVALANAGVVARAPRLRDVVVGHFEATLWALLGSAALVLAIAGANVLSLFLVRAEARTRDTALRRALGAGRGALLSDAFAESAGVAGLAGLLGLAIAWGGVRLLVRLGPDTLPRLHEVGIGGRGLVFTVGLALAAGALFGLGTSLFSRREDLAAALGGGSGRGATVGRRRQRVRQLLVAAQVALALVLATAAGLTGRSLHNLARLDPGFDPRGVLTAHLALPREDYPGDVAPAAFLSRLEESLAALPGIESAGGIRALPIVGSYYLQRHALRDHPVGEDELPPVFQRDIVTPGYFEAMKIPLREGRYLERADHENRTGAVVVSESLARHYWDGESALGKRLAPKEAPAEETGWYTVVGVVGDVLARSLTEEPPEIVYYPMLGKNSGDWRSGIITLVLRGAGASRQPSALAGTLRSELRRLDSNLPAFRIRSLDDVLRSTRAPMAFTVALVLTAAAVALLLAAVGTYGIVSYYVGRRTAEIGVRMALGGRRRHIVARVLRQGLVLAGTGVAGGLVGAFVLTRWLESVLFRVSPLDPLSFAAASMALLTVALAASLIPAQRASRIDPIVALRYE